MRNPISPYRRLRRGRRRSASVRPYVLALERKRAATDAAFDQLAGLAALARLGVSL